MLNAPDFFVEPPDTPQRQKLYRGKPSAKARLASIIDSGEVENYTRDELAMMIGCSPRTIANYLAGAIQMELAEIDESMLPLQTTRGRMLILMDKAYGNCNTCVMVELCEFLVKRDCLLACERPLLEEIYPDAESSIIPDYDNPDYHEREGEKNGENEDGMDGL